MEKDGAVVAVAAARLSHLALLQCQGKESNRGGVLQIVGTEHGRILESAVWNIKRVGGVAEPQEKAKI